MVGEGVETWAGAAGCWAMCQWSMILGGEGWGLGTIVWTWSDPWCRVGSVHDGGLACEVTASRDETFGSLHVPFGELGEGESLPEQGCGGQERGCFHLGRTRWRRTNVPVGLR